MTQPSENPVKEAVVTKPEETTPAPETVPPAVTPKPEVDTTFQDLCKRVDDLTETVQGIVNNGTPEPDTTPVRKPWTHWGGR